MFEVDDGGNWGEEQTVHRGLIARRYPLHYAMALGRARYDEGGLPGKTTGQLLADEGARGLYRHWADMMSGASWPDLASLKVKRERIERASKGLQPVLLDR